MKTMLLANSTRKYNISFACEKQLLNKHQMEHNVYYSVY